MLRGVKPPPISPNGTGETGRPRRLKTTKNDEDDDGAEDENEDEDENDDEEDDDKDQDGEDRDRDEEEDDDNKEDSTDRTRMPIVVEILYEMARHPNLTNRSIPV